MQTIPVGNRHHALIDDDDFEIVSQYKWNVLRRGQLIYARTRTVPSIMMHRLILGAESDDTVDHADCNGLNNIKDNLRLCTQKQNSRNRRKTVSCTSSIYKGVNRHKASGRWRAKIVANETPISLGYFPTERAAAHAYDSAAILHFAGFARPNFIQHLDLMEPMKV